MEFDVRRGSGRYSRRNINGLKPQMGVDEIDFNTIYVNAIQLSEDVQIFGYVRAWKSGKVGYSVLEEATDRPDLSDCGLFWMRPEDFVKVFKVFGKRSDNSIVAETQKGYDAGDGRGSCVAETESRYHAGDGRNSCSAEMENKDDAEDGKCDSDYGIDTKNGSDVKNETGNSANMDSIVEFREKVKKGIMGVFPDGSDDDGLILENVEVVKINDQKLYGIVFRNRRERTLCPMFYLNDSYENYIHGFALDNIVKNLALSYVCSVTEHTVKMVKKIEEIDNMGTDEFEEFCNKCGDMDPEEVLEKLCADDTTGSEGKEALMKDYEDLSLEDIKDRLAVKVLAKERNREFLKKMPHKDIDFGFSVVFDVQNVIGGNDVWRMPVTEGVLKEAGVSEDELYEIAMKNVNEVDPAVLMSVERAASGKKVKNLLENDKRVSKKGAMYVLTNRCGKYGAAALFYPGMQKRIADKLGDSYFAIPSSLHEFIIVPESSGADMVQLRKTLWNDNLVNENQEDVFCNEILHYDRKWGELACVTDMIGGGGAEC